MICSSFESGLLDEAFPYIKLGQGKKTLVIFPPMNDALFDVRTVSWFLAWYCYSFTKKYTVYVISRRRGLPIGYSTEDMAGDYAKVFAKHFPHPVDILGISLGGLIAQYFAALYPQYVRRLVLAVTGSHIGPDAIKTARRWIPWARKGKWVELYHDMVDLTYTGYHRPLYRVIMPMMKMVFEKKISTPSDFIIAGQAALLHDGSDCLPSIRAKTLVIGGDRDHFFPPECLEDLAKKIRHAELEIIPGAGHGAFEEHKGPFDRAVLHFLNHERN